MEIRALALISLIESGEVTGQPLAELAVYGDLRDCRKIYFGETGDSITHRIVYRILDTSSEIHIEVVLVVAIEAREEGYAYLLAASRLGVLPKESRKRFNRVHQRMIARRGRKPF